MESILKHITTLPEGFEPVNKVNRLYNGYEQSVANDQLDWALGELSAYATLLIDGHHVRMSGQDVRRGTFSHRHAILKSQDGESTYNRLDGLTEDQARLHIYNSLLSEYAVLGFEYGYSTASPENLVIWEAQFGDFANGAMTIFDQFISSGESKWGRMSGLTVLLPHGYEGQGPEHSSARLERFLQLCAEFNMVVANVTMPANMFHLLRRQLTWNFRKPLIVMSPKSGLRHEMAVSSIRDFGPGTRFREILDDPTVDKPDSINRVLLCSGKVYFDLAKYKAAEKRDDIAIVRFEQLFPCPRSKYELYMSGTPTLSFTGCRRKAVTRGPGVTSASSFCTASGWDWTLSSSTWADRLRQARLRDTSRARARAEGVGREGVRLTVATTEVVATA